MSGQSRQGVGLALWLGSIPEGHPRMIVEYVFLTHAAAGGAIVGKNEVRKRRVSRLSAVEVQGQEPSLATLPLSLCLNRQDCRADASAASAGISGW